MRKRYQKIHKRGQTELERETQGKKDGTFREEDRYKKKNRDDQDDKYKSDRFDDRHEPLAIALASKEIPPQIKAVMRMMVQNRHPKEEQQKNKGSLLKFMLVLTALMMGLSLTLDNGWGRLGGEVVDSFTAIVVVAIVLAPVIMFMALLNKVLPSAVVGWIGAIIIIFMALSFVGYVMSNWGY